MLRIYPIKAFNDNYIWALRIDSNNYVYVVDPGDAKPVLSYLNDNKLTLAGIIITHHHGDHTGGIQELTSSLDIPVYGPMRENIAGITHKLAEGDEITLAELANVKFKILDVPGHTSGHIAYYGEGSLFCGDTLFVAGCGRLFEGTPAQMYSSLNKFKVLPKTTKVYCAHEYTLANLKFAAHIEPDNQDITAKLKQSENLRANNTATVPSTIESELKTNPFLRADSLDYFTKIRKLKDNF